MCLARTTVYAQLHLQANFFPLHMLAFAYSQDSRFAAHLLEAHASLTCRRSCQHIKDLQNTSMSAVLPHALVGSRCAGGRHYASDVAARVPGVPRVHAQHIQHVPEVEPDRRHPQRHLERRQLCAQPAQRVRQLLCSLSQSI